MQLFIHHQVHMEGHYIRQELPHDVTCLLQYICVYSTLCMCTCVYHNMHAVWAYNVLYVQMCSFTNRNTNMSLIHRNTSDRFVFTMYSSLVQFLSLPTPVPDLDMASWVGKLGIELLRFWDNPHIHEKRKNIPFKTLWMIQNEDIWGRSYRPKCKMGPETRTLKTSNINGLHSHPAMGADLFPTTPPDGRAVSALLGFVQIICWLVADQPIWK